MRVRLGSFQGFHQADPFKTWDWDAPVNYENGVPIPAADDLSYTLNCGTTSGGPYDVFSTLLNEPPPDVDVDMGPLVNNTPGDYYCVATATSILHGTESGPSNEVNFTVLPGDLGLRPEPPVLRLN